MPTTTPFPKHQANIPLRPGGYVALSTTPLHNSPAPAGGASPDPGDGEQPWLATLTRTLNRALAGLNGALLQANAQHAQGADTSAALRTMNESLTTLDSMVAGLFWPPVRPPFRGRDQAGNAAESDQFPLKPESLPPNHHGYVTFRCDVVQGPHAGEVASWGFATNFSVVFYAASERREPSSEVVRDVGSERRREPDPSDPRRQPGSSANVVAAGANETRREPGSSDPRPSGSSTRREPDPDDPRRRPGSSTNVVAAGANETRREPGSSDARPSGSSTRREPDPGDPRREPGSSTRPEQGSSERRR